ncbi:MAG: hypothetical protein DI635_05940 [Pseudoxanthomonas suwonensis]|nr:MAG: hypothetical protein DI635_05940 [Pseudoxanthomonas suwonensis]
MSPKFRFPLLVFLPLSLLACQRTPTEEAALSPVAEPASNMVESEPETAIPISPPAQPEPAADQSLATALPPAAASASATPSGAWQFTQSPGETGLQEIAALRSTDGTVTLRFVDDPAFGKDRAFIEPADGNIDCPVGCAVRALVDGSEHTLQGSRPVTEPPVLSILKPENFWKSLQDHESVSVAYPTDAGPREVQFRLDGIQSAPVWK